MNRVGGAQWVVHTVMLTAALASATTSAGAGKPDEAAPPAKPVVVKNPGPMPIEGDVNAKVNGTVPVLVENHTPISAEGPVLVTNPDPISIQGALESVVTGTVGVENFDQELDGLESEVGEVRRGFEDLQGTGRVSWTWTWGRHTFWDDECASPAPGTWDGLQTATISADNDGVRVFFYAEEDCQGGPVFTLGSRGTDLSTLLPIHSPVPVDGFRSMSIVCWHATIARCEVDVSMAGSRPAP